MPVQLTPTQLALVEERMHDPKNSGPLPVEQPGRFNRRITVIQNVTAKDRTWSRARASELWPNEYQDYLAAVAAP
jgi:hypothetical protein